MDAKGAIWFTTCTLLTGLCLGCGDEAVAPKSAGVAPQANANDAPPAALPPPKATAPDQSPQPNKQQLASPGVEAKAGVGSKGQGYGDEPLISPITTAVKTKFRAAEIVEFGRVTHDLQIFKAINGRGPRSHEEFMEAVIRQGAIDLPELPAGKRYQYDVQTEKLMVVDGP